MLRNQNEKFTLFVKFDSIDSIIGSIRSIISLVGVVDRPGQSSKSLSASVTGCEISMADGTNYHRCYQGPGGASSPGVCSFICSFVRSFV